MKKSMKQTLVFITKTCLQASQVPVICGKVWRKEELLSEDDQAGEYFMKLNIHKFMAPGYP